MIWVVAVCVSTGFACGAAFVRWWLSRKYAQKLFGTASSEDSAR